MVRGDRSTIDNPLYVNIRRELGKDKEEQLIEAIQATRSDAATVMFITISAGLVLFLTMFLLSAFSVSDMAMILIIPPMGILLITLIGAWGSIKSPYARSRFGATGQISISHEAWLKRRVKYGFWKALTIHIGWGLLVIIACLILVAIVFALGV